jgi:hypothetical protein
MGLSIFIMEISDYNALLASFAYFPPGPKCPLQMRVREEIGRNGGSGKANKLDPSFHLPHPSPLFNLIFHFALMFSFFLSY